MKRQQMLVKVMAFVLLGNLLPALADDKPAKHSAEAKAAKEAMAADRNARQKPVVSLLNSGDPQKVTDAVSIIRQSFADDPKQAADMLRTKWGQSLFFAKRYEEITAWSLTGAIATIGAAPHVDTLFQFRVRALTGAGRTNEALVAAKSLYNVCTMRNTSIAIDLVAQALEAAHPEDRGIGKRFKLEQLAAANETNTTATSAIRTNAVGLLAGIVVDRSPYQAQIDKLAQSESIRADTFNALGNLYLLADQPAKAEETFSKIFDASQFPRDVSYAIEGIARARRAADGNVRRANAYILEQRAKEQASATKN